MENNNTINYEKLEHAVNAEKDKRAKIISDAKDLGLNIENYATKPVIKKEDIGKGEKEPVKKQEPNVEKKVDSEEKEKENKPKTAFDEKRFSDIVEKAMSKLVVKETSKEEKELPKVYL